MHEPAEDYFVVGAIKVDEEELKSLFGVAFWRGRASNGGDWVGGRGELATGHWFEVAMPSSFRGANIHLSQRYAFQNPLRAQ
jgi:hypothetical protein